MDRRSFLRGLTLTAAGLLVPTPKVYSFLWNNPLAPPSPRFLRVERGAITTVVANLDQWGAFVFYDERGIWIDRGQGPQLLTQPLSPPAA